MSNVVVLNSFEQVINVVPWEHAIKLVVLNKAVVVKTYVDKFIRTVNKSFPMPRVIKYLNHCSEVFRKTVRFSTKLVFLRDEYTCAYCGKKILNDKELTCDHINPKSQGGKSTFVNTITACFTCNQKKANRTPEQANMKLLKKPYELTVDRIRQLRIKNA